MYIFPQVWRSNLDRDHPDTIKRRFVSAAFMTIVSPVFVWKFGAGHLLEKYSLMDLIGLRTPGTQSYFNSFSKHNLIELCYPYVFPGLIQASVLPLLLTMILFLGPTAMLLLDVSCKKKYEGLMANQFYLIQERFRVFCVPMFWKQSLQVKNTNHLENSYGIFNFRTGFGGGIMLLHLLAKSSLSEPVWCQCY